MTKQIDTSELPYCGNCCGPLAFGSFRQRDKYIYIASCEKCKMGGSVIISNKEWKRMISREFTNKKVLSNGKAVDN